MSNLELENFLRMFNDGTYITAMIVLLVLVCCLYATASIIYKKAITKENDIYRLMVLSCKIETVRTLDGSFLRCVSSDGTRLSKAAVLEIYSVTARMYPLDVSQNPCISVIFEGGDVCNERSIDSIKKIFAKDDHRIVTFFDISFKKV